MSSIVCETERINFPTDANLKKKIMQLQELNFHFRLTQQTTFVMDEEKPCTLPKCRWKLKNDI
jgi:hypothetical protein